MVLPESGEGGAAAPQPPGSYAYGPIFSDSSIDVSLDKRQMTMEVDVILAHLIVISLAGRSKL